MTIKILAIADVHLGRLPSRLPADENISGDLNQRSILRRLPGLAQQEAVDAVVLLGDLTESAGDLFAAYELLSRLIKELLAVGIPVAAVAGNHDFDVLPRLAAELPAFHLLGRDGTWEERLLPTRAGGHLRLQGRSFVGRYDEANPLSGYQFPADAIPTDAIPTDAIPTVALLHCDLDQSESRYAPVLKRELAAQPISAWLLGHLHTYQVLQKEHPLIAYPGSLQGLDPAESGPHGALLLQIEPDQVTSQLLPLATLRYEHLIVDAADADGIADLRQAILRRLHNWQQEQSGCMGATQAVCLRLKLQGRSPLAGRLAAVTPQLQAEHLDLGGVLFYIDEIINELTPVLPLEELSAVNDLPGLLAQRILVLQQRQPTEEYQRLLTAVRKKLKDEGSDVLWEQAGCPPWEDEELRRSLLETAVAALDALLAQKEQRP